MKQIFNNKPVTIPWKKYRCVLVNANREDGKRNSGEQEKVMKVICRFVTSLLRFIIIFRVLQWNKQNLMIKPAISCSYWKPLEWNWKTLLVYETKWNETFLQQQQ